MKVILCKLKFVIFDTVGKGNIADAVKAKAKNMSLDQLRQFASYPGVGDLIREREAAIGVASSQAKKVNAQKVTGYELDETNTVADSIEEEVWGVKPIAIADNGKLPPKPFTPVSGNSGQSSFIDKNHVPKDLGKNRNNIA